MNIQNQTILCIFAHPDDEAFGPGGTIALLSKENHVELLCVTDGNDPGHPDNLASIRMQELQNSAKILGVKKLHFLGYQDGHLSNSIYHELAESITKVVTQLQPDILVTYELRGVSGHIDHMAVAAVTSYVYTHAPHVQAIWYYCESKDMLEKFPGYFIYMPPGVQREDADMIVDTSTVYKTKVKAMHQHISQKKNAELILELQKNMPREEYFLVLRKNA